MVTIMTEQKKAKMPRKNKNALLFKTYYPHAPSGSTSAAGRSIGYVVG